MKIHYLVKYNLYYLNLVTCGVKIKALEISETFILISLINNDVTKTKWRRRFVASNELVSSDSCKRLNPEDEAII